MVAAGFISRTGAEPLVWGRNDCATWAASLWNEAHGVDPAAALRGTYGTWNDCRVLLVREGGLQVLCRRLMAPWAAGGPGDGICVARVGSQIMAGVISGDRLWLKGDGKVISPRDYHILDRWAI
jgi:hypothetical protein